MIAEQQLDALDPQQMRQALLTLMAEMAAKDELLARREREATFRQALKFNLALVLWRAMSRDARGSHHGLPSG